MSDIKDYHYAGCVYRTASFATAASLADFATSCGATSPAEALAYLDSHESDILGDLRAAAWTLPYYAECEWEDVRELAQELIRSAE